MVGMNPLIAHIQPINGRERIGNLPRKTIKLGSSPHHTFNSLFYLLRTISAKVNLTAVLKD